VVVLEARDEPGAGTFPAAGAWGASGRNTASVVLAKMSLQQIPGSSA
jgi:hypothetical protein